MICRIVTSYRLAKAASHGVIKRSVARCQELPESGQDVRVQRLLPLRPAGRVVDVETPVAIEMKYLVQLFCWDAVLLHPLVNSCRIPPVAGTFSSRRRPCLWLSRRRLGCFAEEQHRSVYSAATFPRAKRRQGLDDCRQRISGVGFSHVCSLAKLAAKRAIGRHIDPISINGSIGQGLIWDMETQWQAKEGRGLLRAATQRIQHSLRGCESPRLAHLAFRSQGRRDRHKEPSRFSRYRRKSIGSIESHGAIVFGIDDDGESADPEVISADCGIENQGSA